MNEQNFWNIIHLIKHENYEIIDGTDSLALLSSYDYNIIIEFEIYLRKKISTLHNCRTASVSIIFGGREIGSLGYLDFLCWVISKGEVFYNLFLKDPNIVADDILCTFEHTLLLEEQDIVNISDNAYMLKFGGSIEDDVAPRAYVSQFLSYEIYEDLGCQLDDETLEKNYPKLWRGYWDIWNRRMTEQQS